MSDFADKPNCLHVSGDRGYNCHFGSMVDCDPIVLAGPGHHPHIQAHFKFGLRLELDRATASEFARALTESVNAMPPMGLAGGDCSGIVAELGGDV